MIRRVFAYALGIVGVLTIATAVRLHASLAPMDAGPMFGLGVAFVALALIVLIGFPDTRGRGL